MAYLHIHTGNEDIDVRIVSVNQRCVSIVIGEDMSVTMRVPVGMSRAMAERYLRMNEAEILRTREGQKKRNHQSLPVTLELEEGRVQYRSGQMLPFMGSMDMELRVAYLPQGEDTSLYVEKRPEGGQILTVRTDNGDPGFLRYCIMRYYKKCAAGLVRRKTLEYGRRMHVRFRHVQITGQRSASRALTAGLHHQNIAIREQKTLWGSCSRGKTLRFDWRIIMLPEEIIDYIIVHELAHLRKMNHSAAFWTEVEKVMPEYRECRSWLDRHGKEYEIF